MVKVGVEMEEDIKVLEGRVNFCKNNKECREELKQCFGCTFEIEEIRAIENLIKRNKYLEERSNKINEQNIKYQNTLEKLQKETIWKSKVEEEFEKITEHKNCFNLGDMQLLLDNILGDD